MAALLALLLGGWLAGCAGSEPAGNGDAPPVRVATAFTPSPPAVGPAQLTVTLTDAAGRPVDDARVEVEGNMNHAGMVPVLGSAAGGEEGRYTVPLDLTMGGDWLFLVQVTLADGTTVEHRVDARVAPRA